MINQNLKSMRYLALVTLAMLKTVSASATTDFTSIANSCKTYEENEQITLKGVLKEVEAFGPPNFGEHPESDEKLTLLVIQSKTPVTCEINEYQTVEWHYMAQLLPSEIPNSDVLIANGTEVQLKGSVFYPNTGYHQFSILLENTEIQSLNDK